jgi:prepilin-type N-terminal cleavage/methylation domain-containing protein
MNPSSRYPIWCDQHGFLPRCPGSSTLADPRWKRIRTGTTRIRGMTLLEVLVALLLLSILSVAILSALRTGHRAYATVLRSGRGIYDVATTQRFLRRIIESAYPFGAGAAKNLGRFGLEGTRETLILSAPMPQASGAQGFYRYELSLAPRTDGARDLVIRYGLDRDGKWVGTGPAAESGMEKEVLLERVRDLKCDYLAQPEQDSGPPMSPPRWANNWHEATLPMLVRLTVEFDPADSRRWPEFAATPRLTESAQCVFDVISGTCREAL